MSILFEKPFLLSIGPQRAGAKYIYDHLKARGDVCLPAGVKEVFFFDRHYNRGAQFYENHFPIRSKHNLISEISTTAFDHPDAPRRVRDTFGEAIKLVCPLRNPVQRSLAVYQDYLRYGIVSGGIEEAIEQAPQILFSSRYADHLERWFEVFDQSAIKIMLYEDAEKDLKSYIQALENHADLPQRAEQSRKKFDLSLGRIFTKFKTRNVLPPANIKRINDAQNWLNHRLLPEVLKLENLLGETLPHWKH